MPENTPIIKQKVVKNYDGIIHFCKPTMEAREKSLEKLVQETGSVFIHPYNNNKVIAGQGTLALEMLRQINRLDTLLIPVGGGGLISGTSLVCSNLKPDLNLVGVEPKMADDAYQSVKKGVIIPSNYPNTIADGLRTSLGDITFHIIQKYVDKIIRVQEESIIKAMRMVWERMKIIIEPSAAVCLAALMDHLDAFKGENIGMVLTGGNVDLDNLPFCNGGSNEL
jgi:threonine dehydratase